MFKNFQSFPVPLGEILTCAKPGLLFCQLQEFLKIKEARLLTFYCINMFTD